MALLVTGCGGFGKEQVDAKRRGGALQEVTIDFQSGFRSDRVELELNREKVFAGVLTTDPIDGLAHHLKYGPKTSARLEAIVKINESQSYQYRIDLKEGRHLGFYRDLDSGRLLLEQRQKPFQYD